LLILFDSVNLSIILHKKGAFAIFCMACEQWKKEGLTECAKNGSLEGVKYLVENGADVHAGKDLPLSLASSNGHLEVVEYLIIEGKADVHSWKEEALRKASQHGHLKVVRYLVEVGGADVRACENHTDCESAMQLAIMNGHLAVMTYLESQGATPCCE
jgi:ankyrin repeat protein